MVQIGDLASSCMVSTKLTAECNVLFDPLLQVKVHEQDGTVTLFEFQPVGQKAPYHAADNALWDWRYWEEPNTLTDETVGSAMAYVLISEHIQLELPPVLATLGVKPELMGNLNEHELRVVKVFQEISAAGLEPAASVATFTPPIVALQAGKLAIRVDVDA